MRSSLRFFAFFALSFLIALPTLAEHHEGGHAHDAQTFMVDAAHSTVGFSIRHIFTPVHGTFGEFSGKVVYDADQPADSMVEMTVQAKSIDTGNENRDNHLRSADFFEVETYPTLSFRSKSVAEKGDTLHVTGDFTLHGVTKEITIPVEVLGVMDTPMGTKAGFHTEFEIDRSDYGIDWNKPLGVGKAMLGGTVKIEIAIEADLKTKDKAAR